MKDTVFGSGGLKDLGGLSSDTDGDDDGKMIL